MDWGKIEMKVFKMFQNVKKKKKWMQFSNRFLLCSVELLFFSPAKLKFEMNYHDSYFFILNLQ